VAEHKSAPHNAINLFYCLLVRTIPYVERFLHGDSIRDVPAVGLCPSFEGLTL